MIHAFRRSFGVSKSSLVVGSALVLALPFGGSLAACSSSDGDTSVVSADAGSNTGIDDASSSTDADVLEPDDGGSDSGANPTDAGGTDAGSTDAGPCFASDGTPMIGTATATVAGKPLGPFDVYQSGNLRVDGCFTDGEGTPWRLETAMVGLPATATNLALNVSSTSPPAFNGALSTPTAAHTWIAVASPGTGTATLESYDASAKKLKLSATITAKDGTAVTLAYDLTW